MKGKKYNAPYRLSQYGAFFIGDTIIQHPNLNPIWAVKKAAKETAAERKEIQSVSAGILSASRRITATPRETPSAAKEIIAVPTRIHSTISKIP